MTPIYSIADGSTITTVDRLPTIQDGYIWWQYERREVRDVHETRNGIQIELYRPYRGIACWV